MGRSRMALRTAALGGGLLADVLLIALWGARPRRVYCDWLGWVGDPGQAPLRVVGAWYHGPIGPKTPLGLMTQFDAEDLLVALALLAALVLLVAALVLTCAGGSLPWLRFGRFRLRTALALIALIGLDLGWELDGWRRWDVWKRYTSIAQQYHTQEAHYWTILTEAERELAALETTADAPPGDTRTQAARAADRVYRRDRLQRVIGHARSMAAVYGRLTTKYLQAAADPWRPVDPDPPRPDDSALWPLIPRGSGPAAALAALTELTRRYPDLFWAHQQRAWILAASDDPLLRDGTAAIAAATRACELTQWRNHDTLQILAAAHAEAGDFPVAIDWQEKALERCVAALADHSNGKVVLNDAQRRCDLYRAGKPYRVR